MGEPAAEISAEELSARWPALMQDMKERRQAPAAAVFEEARVEGFGDGLLELAFPKELAIYAKLASDTRHVEALQESLQRNFGVKPRLESRVSDGSTGPEEDAAEHPRSNVTAPPENAPPPESGTKSPDRTVEPPIETGDPGDPEDPGPAENGGADDTIGSEQEALALAREWFGSSNENGGS